MSAEDRLNAFLQADHVAERDLVFLARLEERMARTRLHARLRHLGIIAIAVSAIVFGLMKASGFDLISSASRFAVDLAATPGLALAALIVAAAVLLPRILPGNLIR